MICFFCFRILSWFSLQFFGWDGWFSAESFWLQFLGWDGWFLYRILSAESFWLQFFGWDGWFSYLILISWFWLQFFGWDGGKQRDHQAPSLKQNNSRHEKSGTPITIIVSLWSDLSCCDVDSRCPWHCLMVQLVIPKKFIAWCLLFSSRCCRCCRCCLQ